MYGCLSVYYWALRQTFYMFLCLSYRCKLECTAWRAAFHPYGVSSRYVLWERIIMRRSPAFWLMRHSCTHMNTMLYPPLDKCEHVHMYDCITTIQRALTWTFNLVNYVTDNRNTLTRALHVTWALASYFYACVMYVYHHNTWRKTSAGKQPRSERTRRTQCEVQKPVIYY